MRGHVGSLATEWGLAGHPCKNTFDIASEFEYGRTHFQVASGGGGGISIVPVSTGQLGPLHIPPRLRYGAGQK